MYVDDDFPEIALQVNNLRTRLIDELNADHTPEVVFMTMTMLYAETILEAHDIQPTEELLQTALDMTMEMAARFIAEVKRGNKFQVIDLFATIRTKAKEKGSHP